MRNGQAPADQSAAQKSALLYACAMWLLPWKWLDLAGILESECKNRRGAKALKASAPRDENCRRERLVQT
ncbi:hypothetical protein ASG35_06525 [Burkholderia sp. Leaf177]|nr:hypothetical protein ASG35_06525 [Burkholderia sp. Leaf177]